MPHAADTALLCRQTWISFEHHPLDSEISERRFWSSARNALGAETIQEVAMKLKFEPGFWSSH